MLCLPFFGSFLFQGALHITILLDLQWHIASRFVGRYWDASLEIWVCLENTPDDKDIFLLSSNAITIKLQTYKLVSQSIITRIVGKQNFLFSYFHLRLPNAPAKKGTANRGR